MKITIEGTKEEILYILNNITELTNIDIRMNEEDKEEEKVINSDIFTVKYISDIFGVTEETVRRWARTGTLKGEYSSKKSGFIFTADSVNSFINTHKKYKSRFNL